ncbi:MAG: tRNA pseudouridine 55 synthase [Candidatus Campylobacter infans]|nr:MAG: tRNA pseudouridine 55 synthase [Candidatus Campylobacter infans]
MNRLFVANKPINISSNRFLGQLKKKYKVKNAGFSGTLDPFASGCLIIAFGAYTKLFNYINQAPKCYEATIWLGAKSASLDNENIEKISILEPFLLKDLQNFTNQLIGEIEFTPPKYSAKHINGARAYDLARKGIDFELKTQKMQVFSAQILNYSHPFLTISLKLSHGGYARSWAELLAKKLNCDATLSALKRISEGDFFYENEKALNPLDFLKLNKNEYLGDESDIALGKKLKIQNFKEQKNGLYLIAFDDFFSIIEIFNGEVKYKLNRISNVVDCAQD